jgi:hypothetical protein
MRNLREEMLNAIDKFCADKDMSYGTFSTYVLSSGSSLHRIREGANFTVLTYERVFRFIEANQLYGITEDVLIFPENSPHASHPTCDTV